MKYKEIIWYFCILFSPGGVAHLALRNIRLVAYFSYILDPCSVLDLHDKRSVSSLKSLIIGKKIDEKLVGFSYISLILVSPQYM